MGYLDTHARTTSTTKADNFQPMGRTTALFGVFVGFVKGVDDVQRNGRLQVWIAELGSAPDNPDGWYTVNYCSPFAGATNNETINKADMTSFDGTQTSYGMWMIPPDINNQVLVMFVNGDPSRGIWIGSLYNQYMNNMVPAMASSINSHQYSGKPVPVAEYNKTDTKITQPDAAFKPFEETKFKGLGNQGLITDRNRGITTSSARREAPSTVFGILTPGPPIDPNATRATIRRKGGSSFIMDDLVGTEYIQLTTKSGAQIKLDETDGFVYLINRDGTAWVQMDKDGNIDIFGARDISVRAQRDFNIRADRNINIEAGQNIFMKAVMDTTEETTTFTYDVNNVPEEKTIPVWAYKGQGEGQGGNIVMQAQNNWQSTTQKGAFLTVVEDDMNINIGNSLKVQTMNGGQNFNSKLGIMMTTDASVDVAATGNIRVGSKGSISVVAASDIIVCTEAGISLNATADIKAIAAGNVMFGSSNFNMQSGDASFSGSLSVQGQTKLSGGLMAGAPVALGGSVPFSPAPEPNPTAAEGAMSAPASRPAEIKPLNDKINILATWEDPESKFKRNSESFLTTVSRFPTYEPCPEHGNFSPANIAGYTPALNEADKTYEGSSGDGNSTKTQPPDSTVPGSNNSSVEGDPANSSVVTTGINLPALRHQLVVHEGLVSKTYLDTTNRLHAGIGHLLRQNEVTTYPLGSPISDDQIETWYSQDSLSAIKIAYEAIGDQWSDLTDVRKRAVIDLTFNLGKTKFSKFSNFISAMKAGDYNSAGRELRDSVWYSQVGRRGRNVQTMVVQNVDPTINVKETRA